MRKAAAILMAVAVLALGVGALARSSVFALRHLRIQGVGAARVTARALALTRRTSLFLISTRVLARRALKADPLAARAEVTITLPHTLTISLVPRQSVALVEAASVSDPGAVEGLYGIDATGRVLPLTRPDVASLPLLTGPGPRPSYLFAEESGRWLTTGLAVVRALPRALRPDVSEIHVGSTGDSAELVLMDSRPVLLGLPQHLSEKFADLSVLLDRYPWPEYAGTGFDLRDAARPSLFTVGKS